MITFSNWLQLYQKTLKKLEFGKAARANFFSGASTIVRVQGANKDKKFAGRANAAKFQLFKRFWYKIIFKKKRVFDLMIRL